MGSIKSIFKRRFRKFVTKFYDPLIEVKVGNQTILTPLSHSLKENVDVHPELNFNLGRLVGYVAQSYKNTKVIDIGANVGDTVAYIRNYAKVRVLCIDGDEKYLDILRKNTSQYSDIAICNTLVGAEDSEIKGTLKVERGTAFLSSDINGAALKIQTLNSILKDFPFYKDANFLKIDTDGYDVIILHGCSNFLIQNQPILFFEFDPYLTTVNKEDPFSTFKYLSTLGYRYVMFYMSNGDFLVSLDLEQHEKLSEELIHYFSGRNIALYTDVCVFPSKDKELFESCVQKELKHYREARHY